MIPAPPWQSPGAAEPLGAGASAGKAAPAPPQPPQLLFLLFLAPQLSLWEGARETPLSAGGVGPGQGPERTAVGRARGSERGLPAEGGLHRCGWDAEGGEGPGVFPSFRSKTARIRGRWGWRPCCRLCLSGLVRAEGRVVSAGVPEENCSAGDV